MLRVLPFLFVLSVAVACSGSGTQPALSQPSPAPAEATATAVADPGLPTATESLDSSPAPAASDDFFTQAGITLPAPEACSGLTQSQTEGPYYKPDTPERTTFFEAGMQGTRLILVGYVLDQNCQPVPGAWLDFWQTDAAGEYDNTGYRLRGHQFTDEQGRYHLDTVLPGLYLSRPIEHIHVKIQPPGGETLTSQLYFPDRPMEGLTVTLEDRGDHMVGYFNFVVQR
jgi:protocatechuate 3,4-dioxygenase beta subunit